MKMVSLMLSKLPTNMIKEHISVVAPNLNL
nr:MAG TPA: hypothetical protein [Caudoviricetes sp.]DAP05480.1 MAG TPA: hypothetical protein [Caudoviricetes sp.]